MERVFLSRGKAKKNVIFIYFFQKNLLNDAKGDDEYKLGIPEYLGKVDFSELVLDEALTYKFENCYFRIGYCK